MTGPAASFANTVGNTLNSQEKQQSAQDRINKWSVAFADAKQHVLLGQGLGFTYSYFQAGPNQFIQTDLTENIGLDLWLRTGLIGLGLFLLALLTSLVNGFATWRLHPDPTVAVLALALFAVVIGMIAKGQVESIFEKLPACHGVRALARHAPQRRDFRRGRPHRHAYLSGNAPIRGGLTPWRFAN